MFNENNINISYSPYLLIIAIYIIINSFDFSKEVIISIYSQNR